MIGIQRLGPDHLQRLRALNTVFADAFDDPDTYTSEPPTDDYLLKVLSKEQVIVLVALEDAVVVGGLVAYEFDKLERARREIYVYDLAVQACHRRRGIGSGLIHAVRKIATARSAHIAYVQADMADGPAIALYRRFGCEKRVLHFDIDPAPDADA